MYRRILQDPLRFPDEIGGEARSILTGLLTRDASQRLGVRGAESIKSHPFFSRHVDWLRLMQKKIQPPFRPSVVSLSVSILTFYMLPSHWASLFLFFGFVTVGERDRYQQL